MIVSKAKRNKVINASDQFKNHAVIGTYEGECADSTITNENGLDITRPVWENVFNSDLYAKAIEHGWYIGFLGHPEDPNCMDFEHACIVMTEGHIDDDGKVYGKFNLLDTPVGRIVKTFCDAGIKLGISVRGAGDIVSNSVDPETFVFRGFDLVTFPAFPESIPTFSEIAASTDLATQAKYKAICNAVKNNLNSITSSSALDTLQEQFAAQSNEYKAIEDRKQELSDDNINNDDDDIDITHEKLNAMTQLYLEQVEANRKLSSELESTKQQLTSTSVQCDRKIQAIERITSAQILDVKNQMESNQNRFDKVLSSMRSANLKYKQEINAATSDLKHKDSVIAGLRKELDETVNAASQTKRQTSNLDAKNKELEDEVKASHRIIAEYQDAYASLFANAVGVNLDDVKVTADTDVKELQRIICGTNTANLSSIFVEPQPIDIVDDDDGDGLVTL